MKKRIWLGALALALAIVGCNDNSSGPATTSTGGASVNITDVRAGANGITVTALANSAPPPAQVVAVVTDNSQGNVSGNEPLLPSTGSSFVGTIRSVNPGANDVVTVTVYALDASGNIIGTASVTVNGVPGAGTTGGTTGTTTATTTGTTTSTTTGTTNSTTTGTTTSTTTGTTNGPPPPPLGGSTGSTTGVTTTTTTTGTTTSSTTGPPPPPTI